MPAGTAIVQTPPPASPRSLIRIQRASSAGFLSLAGSSPVSWPSLQTSGLLTVAKTKTQMPAGSEQHHLFYFLINLSPWQVQQKIIKPSGGKIMSQTLKTGKILHRMLELVPRSFNTHILTHDYQLRFLSWIIKNECTLIFDEQCWCLVSHEKNSWKNYQAKVNFSS